MVMWELNRRHAVASITQHTHTCTTHSTTNTIHWLRLDACWILRFPRFSFFFFIFFNFVSTYTTSSYTFSLALVLFDSFVRSSELSVEHTHTPYGVWNTKTTTTHVCDTNEQRGNEETKKKIWRKKEKIKSRTYVYKCLRSLTVQLCKSVSELNVSDEYTKFIFLFSCLSVCFFFALFSFFFHSYPTRVTHTHYVCLDHEHTNKKSREKKNCFHLSVWREEYG